MITQLHVCNFGLFTQALLEPHPCLTVITGATGSGKSLILEAISLFCTKDLRRAPTSRDKNRPSTLKLHKTLQGTPHIFERKSFSSTVYKQNNTRLTQAEVHAQTAPTMNVFQQFNNTWMSTPHNHLLYPTLCSQEALKNCAQTFHKWSEHKNRITRMRAWLHDPKQSKTQMQQNIQELENLATHAEEEEELLAQQKTFMEYGRVRQLLSTLTDCEELTKEISLKASKATAHLNHAQDLLPQESVDDLKQSLSLLEQGIQGLNRETVALLESHYTEEQLDDALSRCNNRMHNIRTLAHKHKVSPQDLPEKLLQLKDVFAQMDSLETAIENEENKLNQAHEELIKCSDILKDQVLKRGQSWREAMQNTLAQMDMVDTIIDIKITPSPKELYTTFGIYDLLVLIQTNSLHEPKPPHATLSGGEFTRFTLAHKSLTHKTQEPVTFLLDEVESGLSPSVCIHVGQLLQKLSQSHQVIVITHSPFIACFADKHYSIEKLKTGTHYTSHLTHINREPLRIKELIRMLSGTNETDTSARAIILELLTKHARS